MNTIKGLFRTSIYALLSAIQGSSKAIGGALAAVAVAYLSTNGFTLPNGFEDALALVGAAMIGFGITWLSPRNK